MLAVNFYKGEEFHTVLGVTSVEPFSFTKGYGPKVVRDNNMTEGIVLHTSSGHDFYISMEHASVHFEYPEDIGLVFADENRIVHDLTGEWDYEDIDLILSEEKFC